MFSKVNSLGLLGFGAELVQVEIDLSSGLPRFDIVGLPSSSVDESKDRVRSVIKNLNLLFPVSRITVNLAPADFKKEGPIYDLPILMAVLLASRQLKADLSDCAFIGEISLNGETRHINGVLPMAIQAQKCGIKNLFIPQDNFEETKIVSGINIYPVQNAHQLIDHFRGNKPIEPFFTNEPTLKVYEVKAEYDFKDVVGQEQAKRAIEVAAAGGHNILLTGPPGVGKSMLAKCIPGILPGMNLNEIIETSSVYSLVGKLTDDVPLVMNRPFRAPHHSASLAAITGGGTKARPGEVSFANHGVLFLDELPLFPRNVLESLRQPLEDKEITIVRANNSATYPANFMLVASMNPCPCGYYGDPLHICTCTETARRNYNSKLSGPLMDRIDIIVPVEQIDCEQFLINSGNTGNESSEEIRARINEARRIQKERFTYDGISCNAEMSHTMVRKYCNMSEDAQNLLISAYKRMSLSARVTDKILKTARSIADLEHAEKIESLHILEAIKYREII